ncbi:MAG: hypothetical protein ACRD21_06965 [Vicinamibacteria bacterium]
MLLASQPGQSGSDGSCDCGSKLERIEQCIVVDLLSRFGLVEEELGLWERFTGERIK